MAISLGTFTEANPGYYLRGRIYDTSTSAGQSGTIIPRVGSAVNDNGRLLEVIGYDFDDFVPTYMPFIVQREFQGDLLASARSYGNDVFWTYYDNRPQPKRLNIDHRCVIYGSNISKYRIIRDRGTSTEEVISQYYDSDGNFTSSLVPLTRVEDDSGDATNSWILTPCQTTTTLTNGQTLTVEIFSENGNLVGEFTTFARFSAIINEAPVHQPAIVSLVLRSTQMRAENQFYMYEKQSPDSLGITAHLIYDDGHETSVPIDNSKALIYGIADLVGAFGGSTQRVMVKYYLSENEIAGGDITDPTGRHISTEATISVVQNELGSTIKISAIPYWSSTEFKYQMRYRYYSVDRDVSRDITSLVTITQGTFDGTLFGTLQSFQMSVDMAEVDNTVYTEPVIYIQPITVRLQPTVAVERYTLRDSMSSLYIYGLDAPSQRRPILMYDAALSKYFVPTTWFGTEEAMLMSFYTAAVPPYLTATEQGPLTPTHFVIRDIFTNQMVVASQISMENYAAAFNVIGGGSQNRYVGNNVLVEFIRRVSGGDDLILYGVPVDVREGTYVG